MDRQHRCWYGALAVILTGAMTALTAMRLADNDCFQDTSEEVGYVTEQKNLAGEAAHTDTERLGEYALVAEGFEHEYLYSGTYTLTIAAWTLADDACYQVVDRWTNTLIAEGTFEARQEYHSITFTTTENYEDVILRCYAPVSGEVLEDGTVSVVSLELFEYTLESVGPVCTDTIWELGLMWLLIMVLAVGVRRALWEHRPALLTLTLLSSLTSLPFLCEYVPYGHDTAFHIARIYSLGESIAQGNFPQRLNLSMGGNTIAPIMYPELMLYGAGFMVAAGATVWLAYQVLCIFITFLTAFIAYFSARQFAGERTALLFSAIYVLNPFRLNEVFLRSAIGEAFAVAFLPMILAGLCMILTDLPSVGGEIRPCKKTTGLPSVGGEIRSCKKTTGLLSVGGEIRSCKKTTGLPSVGGEIRSCKKTTGLPSVGGEACPCKKTADPADRPRKGSLLLMIGFTGVISSHVIMSLVSAAVCAVFVLILLLVHPRRFVRRWRRLGWILLSAGGTILLNLWFLVPFLHYILTGKQRYRFPPMSGFSIPRRISGRFLWGSRDTDRRTAKPGRRTAKCL